MCHHSETAFDQLYNDDLIVTISCVINYLSQGCIRLGRLLSRATELCAVGPNICGS
jgi:hypothetical protein